MATHCKRCGGRLNRGTKTSYHIKCEPLICECDEPSAGPNGECNTCHRLIVTKEVPDYPDWVPREDIPLIEEKVEIVSRVGCMPIDVAKQSYLNFLIVYGYPGNKEALSGSGIDASPGGSAEQTK